MQLADYAELLKKKKFQKEKVPPPRDQRCWTPPTTPCVLEVGCGQGLHPILFAKENPKNHIVACERTVEKFKKFHGRVTSHGLTNISAVHEDALSWLVFHHKKVHHCFEKIFFLYPNPYPKENQRKKRFFAMPAFSFYLECLKPGGEIILRTNEAFYFEEARTLAQSVWSLKEMSCGEVVTNKGITHFERKYLERGETCYEGVWKKS